MINEQSKDFKAAGGSANAGNGKGSKLKQKSEKSGSRWTTTACDSALHYTHTPSNAALKAFAYLYLNRLDSRGKCLFGEALIRFVFLWFCSTLATAEYDERVTVISTHWRRPLFQLFHLTLDLLEQAVS